MLTIRTHHRFQANRGSADNRNRNDRNKTREVDRTTPTGEEVSRALDRFLGLYRVLAGLSDFLYERHGAAALDCPLQQRRVPGLCWLASSHTDPHVAYRAHPGEPAQARSRMAKG